jgi:uncharacterized protein
MIVLRGQRMVDVTDLVSIKAKVETFVERLRGSIRVSAAYLFGSYARGTATPDSDIDVLILSPDFSDDRFENLILLMKVRRGIDSRIEPHGFKEEEFDESHPFFKEIKTDLIRIV